MGTQKIDYKGYPIRIYSRERMPIELLRYKDKLPFDYYKEVLHSFRHILPQLNMQRVQDYAYASPKSGKIMKTLQAEVQNSAKNLDLWQKLYLENLDLWQNTLFIFLDLCFTIRYETKDILFTPNLEKH